MNKLTERIMNVILLHTSCTIRGINSFFPRWKLFSCFYVGTLLYILVPSFRNEYNKRVVDMSLAELDLLGLLDDFDDDFYR